jgi:hypothetical protein
MFALGGDHVFGRAFNGSFLTEDVRLQVAHRFGVVSSLRSLSSNGYQTVYTPLTINEVKRYMSVTYDDVDEIDVDTIDSGVSDSHLSDTPSETSMDSNHDVTRADCAVLDHQEENVLRVLSVVHRGGPIGLRWFVAKNLSIVRPSLCWWYNFPSVNIICGHYFDAGIQDVVLPSPVIEMVRRAEMSVSDVAWLYNYDHACFGESNTVRNILFTIGAPMCRLLQLFSNVGGTEYADDPYDYGGPQYIRYGNSQVVHAFSRGSVYNQPCQINMLVVELIGLASMTSIESAITVADELYVIPSSFDLHWRDIDYEQFVRPSTSGVYENIVNVLETDGYETLWYRIAILVTQFSYGYSVWSGYSLDILEEIGSAILEWLRAVYWYQTRKWQTDEFRDIDWDDRIASLELKLIHIGFDTMKYSTKTKVLLLFAATSMLDIDLSVIIGRYLRLW